MAKWLRDIRFWLMLYLLIEGVLFYFYSYPYLRSYQQMASHVFIISLIVLAVFLPKKYLIYVVILAALFVDPLYTYSILTHRLLYKALATAVMLFIIICRRKELRLIMITLLAGNMLLFIFHQYKIASIDKNFREQSYIANEKNPLQLQAEASISKGNNIYVIILDGYPAFDILSDSFHYQSKLLPYLKENQFDVLPTFTIYKSTPISLLYIFSSRKIKSKTYPEYLETNSEFYRSALFNSPLADKLKQLGYQYYFFSSILNKKSWAAPLAFYPKYSINDAVTFVYKYIGKKQIQKFNYNTIPLSNSNMNGQLDNVLSDSRRHMSVFHYYTFHNNTQSMTDEAQYADQVGIEAVSRIISKDPKATVIVMSDHGERRHLINIEFMLKGIYTVRKGY